MAEFATRNYRYIDGGAFSMGIGDGVSGGTAGSVLYLGAGAVLSQDNSNLHYDFNNLRLGIKVATPTQTLDVGGYGKFSTGTISPGNVVPADSTLAYAIADSTGSITVVRVDTTNKRVAIGNAPGAPGYTIDVTGTARFTSDANANSFLGSLTALPTNMGAGIAAVNSGGTGASGSNVIGGSRVAFASGYGLSMDAWDVSTPRWGFYKWNGSLAVCVAEGVYSSTNITFNGSVGIGVSPTHQLQLSSDDAAKTTTTTWTTTSDERTKENVTAYNRGLDVIRDLEPVEFDYNGEFETPKGEHAIGLVAQRHIDAAPELFRTWAHPVGEPEPLELDEDGQPLEEQPEQAEVETAEVLGHNPHALFYMMINALKELDARLAALEAR